MYVGDYYTLLHTQYISCGSHGFRDEVFIVVRIVSLRELMTPGHGQFGPQWLDWQFDVVVYYTLLHTKYISSGPHGFREEEFLSFVHYKFIGANDLWDVAIWDPRGMVGRIYIGDYLSSLHT